MFYQIHDWQRSALAPWRALARAGSAVYGHPHSPLRVLPGSRNVSAALDVMARVLQRYERPAFAIPSVVVDGRETPVIEEVALVRPFCRLLHFARPGAPKQPRVLVFAPLSGHFATLLRDTVQTLLCDHDVWITDWIDAREVPAALGPFHLDDYVAYVRQFIAHLGPEVHAIAVCQPTVPVLAGVALSAAAGGCVPRSLTLMGGPVDARRSPTEVNKFATSRPLSWFAGTLIQRVPVRYPGFLRPVYPGYLQHTAFVAMNPGRHMKSHVQYYRDLVRGEGEGVAAHRRFYDEYNAVMDLPAEYYLETVERVFQKHQLATGALVCGGEPVRPAAIRSTALLTVEGELDDISGSGQTAAAQGLCAGIPAERRQHLTAAGAGHYGIFSGRRWREAIYPELRGFIRRHE